MPIGEIKLAGTYFDNDISKHLFDEMDYQRAAQAYIWSMPLVSAATYIVIGQDGDPAKYEKDGVHVVWSAANGASENRRPLRQAGQEFHSYGFFSLFSQMSPAVFFVQDLGESGAGRLMPRFGRRYLKTLR